MSRRIRVLLAGANPYNANKGVAALAYSSIRLINKVAKENKIEIEICVYSHEASRIIDEVIFPEGKVTFRNINPTHISGIHDFIKIVSSRWRLYNLRELLKCDYIFNITAGDSFSDIYGAENFKSVDSINRIARLFKINYSFFPQTYGPFYDEKIKKMAVLSMQKAEVLLSRDEQSRDFVSKILPNKSIKSLIDVAFCLPYKQYDEAQFIGKNVGVNISQTLWDIPRDNNITLGEDYHAIMFGVIDHLLARGYNVHIIPHVVNADNYADNEYYLSYRIWEKYSDPHVKLAPLFLSPVDAKSYIASMDMFIGARMHACIAAFSSGIPVLPLSYSRKFEGLFCDTLHYQYCVNLVHNSKLEKINGIIDEILLNRTEICEQISLTNKSLVAHHLSTIEEEIKKILLKLQK